MFTAADTSARFAGLQGVFVGSTTTECSKYFCWQSLLRWVGLSRIRCARLGCLQNVCWCTRMFFYSKIAEFRAKEDCSGLEKSCRVSAYVVLGHGPRHLHHVLRTWFSSSRCSYRKQKHTQRIRIPFTMTSKTQTNTAFDSGTP